jgi:hypothetical protein
MQPTQPTQTKQRDGLGFLVENLLNDYKNEKEDKKEPERNNECEKKYDEIKQSILSIFKKIKQRKNYHHHKIHNNTPHNKNDAAFSYINYSKVREQYRELLKILYLEKENTRTKYRAKWHVTMLYRLLGYTRDISEGCGERELAYMQIFEMARMDSGAAIHALKTIVSSQSGKLEKSPMGSWKDVKGLVAYMRRTMNMRDERDMAAYLELTKFLVGIVNERIAKDVLAFYKDDGDSESIGHGNKDDQWDGNCNKDDQWDGNCNKDDHEVYDDEVSLVSKWIPRENKSKKYGNFYERLACDYYKDWLPKDRNANPVSYEKAVIKCKIHYRKLVSTLNQYLETPQIKMCQQRWSEIAFLKTTRLTRDLQDRALLNLKSDDHRAKRHVGNADRELCAEKYKVWKCDTILYQAGIKTDLETHVRVAEYHSSCSSFSVNRTAEWAAFASQGALNSRFKRVIPVLAGNSNKAVGLALAVAENAATGRTLILEDGEELILHDLDASFVKNVNGLKRRHQNVLHEDVSNSVYSNPLYKCLISALKLLVESKVPAKQTRHLENVNSFTVMIFTDGDSSSIFNRDTCFKDFKEVWDEASLLYREFGYAVPRVVLWAMKSCVYDENLVTGRGRTGSNENEEEVAYSSVSHDGALTIRAGCDASDICAYLGTGAVNINGGRNMKMEMDEILNGSTNEWHKEWHNEWHKEWNKLVETLYNRRYYEFEKYFWKK